MKDNGHSRETRPGARARPNRALPPLALGAAAVTFLEASQALAYVGPGVGLSVIGTILALIAAVALAVVGFVWYPLKRAFGKKRTSPSARDPGLHRATAPEGHQSSRSGAD